MSYWPQQPGKSGPVLSVGCGGLGRLVWGTEYVSWGHSSKAPHPQGEAASTTEAHSVSTGRGGGVGHSLRSRCLQRLAPTGWGKGPSGLVQFLVPSTTQSPAPPPPWGTGGQGWTLLRRKNVTPGGHKSNKSTAGGRGWMNSRLGVLGLPPALEAGHHRAGCPCGRPPGAQPKSPLTHSSAQPHRSAPGGTEGARGGQALSGALAAAETKVPRALPTWGFPGGTSGTGSGPDTCLQEHPPDTRRETESPGKTSKPQGRWSLWG